LISKSADFSAGITSSFFGACAVTPGIAPGAFAGFSSTNSGVAAGSGAGAGVEVSAGGPGSGEIEETSPAQEASESKASEARRRRMELPPG
jgi:hypothetical protein